MNLCRFNFDHLGLVEDERIYDVTSALEVLQRHAWPFPRHDIVIEHLDTIVKRIAASPLPTESCALDEVALYSPVGNPSKVVAAPVNYRAHVEESEADAEIHANRAVLKIGEAGLFLKATSSIVGPSSGIALHLSGRRTDHEVELAIVIGKQCKNVPEVDALEVVAGYCIGLDITIRGSEDRSFRKSIDSYTVLGPWLTTANQIPNPDALRLELRVNGAQRQDANTSQLIFGVRKLIAWASEWYTLYPGDILLTGTPEGVGPIADGDCIDASIDGLGSIRVAVRSDASSRYRAPLATVK
jgi:2-keto-4-pentenoate hydratase/2-oxohepta-3-ene-1,7-dioic acid hydratase in catechol pathway